jgi:dTMP kinase
MSGKLIVIEGADGAGKATQTKILFERLRTEGVDVETLEFPRYNDTFFGSYVREWLDGTHGDFVDLDPRLSALLFAGDRYESRDVINGWLEAGKHVILDRYVSATLLHQGAKIGDIEKRGAFLLWVQRLEYEVFKMSRPDLVAYLDMPTTMRHALLTTDETRTKLDATETNEEFQLALESCAKHVASMEHWNMVSCMEEEKLRSKDAINAELYALIRPLII